MDKYEYIHRQLGIAVRTIMDGEAAFDANMDGEADLQYVMCMAAIKAAKTADKHAEGFRDAAISRALKALKTPDVEAMHAIMKAIEETYL